MTQTINYKDFNQSYKQIQKEKTNQERRRMLEAGMEELTKDEFLDKLNALNYKVDNDMSFDYYNNLNEFHYLARSMSYTDKASGQSFAHYEQSFRNPHNLEALQKIRISSFVFDKGRIWEL